MEVHNQEIPQEIGVSCRTELALPLDELHAIQGDLKTMSPENRNKLRNLIIKNGINFPVHVWKEVRDRGESDSAVVWWIIDGHGRVEELRSMRADGFLIPEIPCVEIFAKDMRDAKEKVLAASSCFQRIDPDGLHNFLEELEVGPDLLGNYDLPNVDLETFEAEFYDVEPEEPKGKGSEELDRKSFTEFKQSCPRCGFSFDDKKE